MTPDIKANITIKADVTKVSQILIEKISNAIGFCFNYEDKKITRKAKAEAEAKIIKTQTDIEVKKIKTIGDFELNDIQQRALSRVVHQEERKQTNIENIISGALPLITDNEHTEQIDEDWLAYFFAHCDTVSDNDMQSLWSNILANEASNPNRFSKRTIDCIATMSKTEAESFTHLCQFSFILDGEQLPFINRYGNDVYKNQRITFDLLTHLDSIGLIIFNSMAGFGQNEIMDFSVSYFDKPILRLKTVNQITLGQVLFTQIGKELAPICGAKANDEFYNYIVNLWAEQNIIESPAVS